MKNNMLRLFNAVLFCAFAAGGLAAQAADKPFEPYSGQPGKDVVWVPTAQAMVDKMLDLAKVEADRVVLDESEIEIPALLRICAWRSSLAAASPAMGRSLSSSSSTAATQASASPCSSSASTRIAAATSSGKPLRPSGVSRRYCSIRSGAVKRS